MLKPLVLRLQHRVIIVPDLSKYSLVIVPKPSPHDDDRRRWFDLYTLYLNSKINLYFSLSEFKSESEIDDYTTKVHQYLSYDPRWISVDDGCYLRLDAVLMFVKDTYHDTYRFIIDNTEISIHTTNHYKGVVFKDETLLLMTHDKAERLYQAYLNTAIT